MSTEKEIPTEIAPKGWLDNLANQILKKGLAFGLMTVAILVLYGWVVDNFAKQEQAQKKTDARLEKMEQKYDACQEYKYSEAYRVIERVDRRLDEFDRENSRPD
jgi:hypothetical protein